MSDWLAARTEATPTALALIVGDHQWTYAELNDEVAFWCSRLMSAGVTSGSLVALLMPNCFDYVCLVHALIRLEAVLIPLNIRLAPDELNYQLEKTHCRLIICADETVDVASQLANQEYQVYTVGEKHDPKIRHFDGRTIRPLMRGNNPLDGEFAIVFTSGTSGRPKGVVLTYDNIFYSAMASAYRVGTLPDDRWLCVLPLYHVGGLSVLIRACLYGIAVHLHQRFDVDEVNHALVTQPITLVSLVPTMLYRLLEAQGVTRWNGSLRLVLLGGAAASLELLERCQELNIPVATTYGLTEVASQVATALPANVMRKPGTVGKPLLFTSVRIVDEHGRDRPAGEYGEIVVAGPSVMRAYYEDEEATKEALINGELHTGDIGYLDEDGDLWVVQRRSDLIVSGGENIYPAEVEAVLRRHPAVSEVCVVGIPNAEWGQQVTAAVVLRNGVAVTADELIAFSRQYLAGYKLPRAVRFMPGLPQTASGKVNRRAVEELFR